MILGEKPKLIELSFYGIKLERKNAGTNRTEEIAVYASGPLANLVLSAVIFALSNTRGMKTAAIISLCVGLFNLLPCVPLDGGNILHFLFSGFMNEEKSEKVSFFISVAVLVPMAAAGIILFFKSKNITLVAVSVYLMLINFISRKKSP